MTDVLIIRKLWIVSSPLFILFYFIFCALWYAPAASSPPLPSAYPSSIFTGPFCSYLPLRRPKCNVITAISAQCVLQYLHIIPLSPLDCGLPLIFFFFYKSPPFLRPFLFFMSVYVASHPSFSLLLQQPLRVAFFFFFFSCSSSSSSSSSPSSAVFSLNNIL